MNLKTIKRFVKDFNLPIQVPDEQHIEYFVDLYNNVLDTKRKYDMFNDMINRLGNEEAFFMQSANIQDQIINSIKELQSYGEFVSNKMDTFSIKERNIPKDQVYKSFSDNCWFVSIDLIKANYNALKFYSKDLVLNTENYQQFIKLFSEEAYYLESKKFRQIIFGNVNPKRQQRIQRFLIDQLLAIIDQHGAINNVKDITSDEIVLLIDEPSSFHGSQLHVDLNQEINKLGIDVRFDVYQLKHLKPFNYYVREFIDGRVDFRCVPLHHYAQVYKHYFKQELNDTDLMFYTSDYELVKSVHPLKFS
jgi:hypothetical protein